MPQKTPEFSTRLGAIQGTIWKREHDGTTFYNVTINRSYKDDDDKWQTTDSYSPQDLPVVNKIAEVCLSWIIRAQQETRTAR